MGKCFFWYWLIQVVPDQGCCCYCVHGGLVTVLCVLGCVLFHGCKLCRILFIIRCNSIKKHSGIGSTHIGQQVVVSLTCKHTLTVSFTVILLLVVINMMHFSVILTKETIIWAPKFEPSVEGTNRRGRVSQVLAVMGPTWVSGRES